MTPKIEARMFKDVLIEWLDKNNYAEIFKVSVATGVSFLNLVLRFEKEDKIQAFEEKLDGFLLQLNNSNNFSTVYITCRDNIGPDKRSIEFFKKG